jgi:hypothetical protein
MDHDGKREVQMNGRTRAGATLIGVACAGALLWVAAQISRGTIGGYWAAYGVVTGAGLVLAVTQLRGRSGHPPAMFALGFLPVLICAGWVLLGMQPHGNWFRDHVLAWSGHMGIKDVVLDLGTWLGVLAFGIGYTFGLVLEPMRKPAPVEEPVVTDDRTAADEPVTAERHEVDAPVTTRSAR